MEDWIRINRKWVHPWVVTEKQKKQRTQGRVGLTPRVGERNLGAERQKEQRSEPEEPISVLNILVQSLPYALCSVGLTPRVGQRNLGSERQTEHRMRGRDSKRIFNTGIVAGDHLPRDIGDCFLPVGIQSVEWAVHSFPGGRFTDFWEDELNQRGSLLGSACALASMDSHLQE